MRLPAIQGPILAGQPVAVVARDVATSTALPILATVHTGRRVRRIWLYRERQLRDASGTQVLAAVGGMTITPPTARALGVSATGPTPVTMQLPPQLRLRVMAAKWYDLPRGNTLYITADAAKRVTRRRVLQRWTLMTSGGIAAPMRVRTRRDMRQTDARTTLMLRVLLGLDSRAVVQLTRPPVRDRAETASRIKGRVARRRDIGTPLRPLIYIAAVAVIGLRYLDWLVEVALRIALRSPTITLRTMQAAIGDDNDNIARVHPDIFPFLGVRPGQQVLVDWCGATAAAVILEHHVEARPEEAQRARNFQRVENTLVDLPNDFPTYLLIRVPAGVRHELRMPASTVVTIRRRLRPLVLTHLNQLTLPLSGLAAATAAIPELRWWPTITISGGVLVLSFLNLRMTRQPKGIWP